MSYRWIAKAREDHVLHMLSELVSKSLLNYFGHQRQIRYWAKVRILLVVCICFLRSRMRLCHFKGIRHHPSLEWHVDHPSYNQKYWVKFTGFKHRFTCKCLHFTSSSVISLNSPSSAEQISSTYGVGPTDARKSPKPWFILSILLLKRSAKQLATTSLFPPQWKVPHNFPLVASLRL